MTMEKCNCPVCNELNVQDHKEIVESHLEYIINCVQDNDKLKDALFSLLNAGYKLGFTTATMLRIEQDVETLRYMTDNWDN